MDGDYLQSCEDLTSPPLGKELLVVIGSIKFLAKGRVEQLKVGW